MLYGYEVRLSIGLDDGRNKMRHEVNIKYKIEVVHVTILRNVCCKNIIEIKKKNVICEN